MKKGYVNKRNISKSHSSQFLDIVRKAQKEISRLTPKQKTALEKEWDIEHAYYSSALEGSKVDKKEFEKLAKGVV